MPSSSLLVPVHTQCGTNTHSDRLELASIYLINLGIACMIDTRSTESEKHYSTFQIPAELLQARRYRLF